MALKFDLKSGGYTSSNCVDRLGCPDRCPDFTIRRHDTRPALKIGVEDCDGPMDLRGLVVEANMWAVARLRTAITAQDTYFRLADDIGFEQIMIGDIIVMDRVRSPERMLVTGFDEANKLVQVQRGYHGTTASAWTKGTTMRIFRILNGVGQYEIALEDTQNVDGTTDQDVLTEAYLVYEWEPNDTCLPGCYWFEFKILKMIDTVWLLPGGNWVGEYHLDGSSDYYFTGTAHTESSVQLSYDQVASEYYLPTKPWSGESHVYTDGNTYTGVSHDDGSVLLTKIGVSNDSNVSYNEEGVVGAQSVSVTPSFTSGDTVADFGCTLGEGVEWTRRFPTSGEGYLIKIEKSFTPEI